MNYHTDNVSFRGRLLKSVKKQCTSERFLVNIFLTNTDIAEIKVSLERLQNNKFFKNFKS